MKWCRILVGLLTLLFLVATPCRLSARDDLVTKHAEKKVGAETDRAFGILATICRDASIPPLIEYKPGEDHPTAFKRDEKYLKALGRITQFGEDALPILGRVTSDRKRPAFERRLAEILIERIRNSEDFERVSEYYDIRMEPDSPKTRGFARRRLTLKELAPIMIHPEVREAYERELKRQRTGIRTGSLEQRKARAEFTRPGDAWPRLNSSFLAAWEEGMIRPVPWPTKALFASVVAQIGDQASMPSLAEVYRQSFVFDDDKEDGSDAHARRGTRDFVLRELLRVEQQPRGSANGIRASRRQALLEALADIMKYAEGNGRYNDMRKQVGGLLIEEMKLNPMSKELESLDAGAAQTLRATMRELIKDR